MISMHTMAVVFTLMLELSLYIKLDNVTSYNGERCGSTTEILSSSHQTISVLELENNTTQSSSCELKGEQ